MNIISEIVGQIDGSVKDVGMKYFESTASSLEPMLTIMSTLLIILVGVYMALGISNYTARDAWQVIFRIVLVWLFARSWSNFGQVYEALTQTSDSLATSFFYVNGEGGSSAALMDKFVQQMSEVVDGTARSVSSIMRGVLSALLYIVLGLLMAAYVLIVAFAKIMIAFLLGVAPIAIMMTIFDKTKNLFEAWLSSFIGYLMYPIAAAAVVGVVVSLADKQFEPSDQVTALSMILGFVCVAFSGIFALMQIPAAASNITGSFNLGTVAPQAVRMVNRPLTTPASGLARATAARADAFASGAIHGKTPLAAQQSRDREWAERAAAYRQKWDAIMRAQGINK